jgi:hypothetical protein
MLKNEQKFPGVRLKYIISVLDDMGSMSMSWHDINAYNKATNDALSYFDCKCIVAFCNAYNYAKSIYDNVNAVAPFCFDADANYNKVVNQFAALEAGLKNG